MKNFLGFLFQFSIHQEIGVAKNILIGLRTNRYYVWLLIYTIYFITRVATILLQVYKLYTTQYITYKFILYLDMNTLILYNTSIRVCG